MSALLDELRGPETDWTADALCSQTDPEVFFPEKGGSTREAKKVCGSCDVRDRCLQYAIHNDERFGIWGGLSERERRRLRSGKTRLCNGCNAPLSADANRSTRYCEPCGIARRRYVSAVSNARSNDERAPERHPWQDRPRRRIPHTDNETEAFTVVTGTAGPDLTIVPSGRTLEDDLTKAEARRARGIVADPDDDRTTDDVLADLEKKTPHHRHGETRRLVVHDYQTGMRVADVAERHGVTPVTVYKHLTAAGVQLRPRRRLQVTPKPAPKPTPRPEPAPAPRQASPAPKAPRPKVAGTTADRRRGPKTQPRNDFVDLYEQGYTIPLIAQTFGTYPKTVRTHLLRAGVQLRDDRAGHSGGRNRRTFAPEQLSAMATAYLAGATIADLAPQYATGRRQIRDALTELRIQIRPAAHQKHTHREDRTLVITVEPTKGTDALTVADEIKLKLPEHDRDASLFFTDALGNLTRRDPNQLEFEGLRGLDEPATPSTRRHA